jgi:predicted outer membrane protein
MGRTTMGLFVALLTACHGSGTDEQTRPVERASETRGGDTIWAQTAPKADTQKSEAQHNDAPKRAETEKDPRALVRVMATIDLIQQAEIERAELAQKNAQTQGVKDYASRVLADYKQDAEAMKKMVADKSIDLRPAKDDPLLKAHEAATRDEQRKLKDLKGTTFEATYLADEPSGSRMLAKLADEGKKASTDPEVTNFFNKLRSQADDHEKRAMALLPKACGGTAASSAEPGIEGKPKPSPQRRPAEPSPGTEPGAPPNPQMRPDEAPPETTPPERVP